jgi:hypothetical protein
MALADSDFPFGAAFDADAITTAILKSHAEYITGREGSRAWDCQHIDGKADFQFASADHRDRFVRFVWGLEHLRAEVF